MTRCQLKRFWATVAGAIIGFKFGEISVIWAWLYETELWGYVHRDGRISYGQPLTEKIMCNPIIYLLTAMVLGGALAFLVAYTFTAAGEETAD